MAVRLKLVETPIESQNIALTELRTAGRPSKKVKKNKCYDKEIASSQFVKPVTQVTQVVPSAPTRVATTYKATDDDATANKAAPTDTVALAATNNTVATAALITIGQMASLILVKNEVEKLTMLSVLAYLEKTFYIYSFNFQ